MGHAVVDQLTVDISNRLRGRLRHDDIIARPSSGFGTTKENASDEILARMDGDQFTVMLEGIKDPSEPMRVALRLQETLAAPFSAKGVDVYTSASIGIAISSSSLRKPEEMLRDADIAMVRARAQGPSRCEVFDTQMHAMVVRRLNLESELRKCIERDELRVLYQPIVNLTNGGAWAVIDLVGSSGSARVGFDSLIKGGKYIIVGLYGGDLTVSLPPIPMRALTIQGSYTGSQHEMRELMELVRRTGLPPVPVATRPLNDVNAVMGELRGGKIVGRVVLTP